jgi:HD-GYP domain-containing protein (c-di-GMP phosphodiesterase class II)
MSIDYKKELEIASRTMILVHDPDLLIKMMIRTIVQKIKVTHCSVLLHNRTRDSYILKVSRGRSGLKVPEGFTRMDLDNPLIRFFRERKTTLLFNSDVLLYDEAKKLLNLIADSEVKELLGKVLYQMEMFETVACIPSYFREDLVGILLLGKKNDETRFDRNELDFFIALNQDAAMAIRNAQLFHDLTEELKKKENLFINTTVAMAAAIEAKDRYTHGHTTRVTNFSLEIARKLEQKDLLPKNNSNFSSDLRIASLLHDIGKIGVPEAILNKEGVLDPEERKKINEHPMIGVTILQRIHEFETVILGVKYHHERFDGKGYPEGLKGDQIPMIAAIIAVADSYDAMTSDRPYRKGFPKEKAIEIIKQESGKQFDPVIVEAFLEVIAENKI